jgi:FtsP/CotA-like multicopper oxidase with cupredoxin domain
VVDSALGPIVADRVFVLERWNGATRTAINGKSWPYTERLTYPVGETVHWKVVNVSDLSHPMHLHGAHFTVDAAGDAEHYQKYAPGTGQLVFTRTAEIGDAFEMSWCPTSRPMAVPLPPVAAHADPDCARPR